ncbi:dolichyldiphosphatase 1-like isoform X3 [Macrobrachium rosenbergii]|uniref:dolichyldiphosphatase 1-like isoform X3 n=1 Tax=Macrobrachium rosenbergii TaxID=79674 RepID=UPI0034D64EAE
MSDVKWKAFSLTHVEYPEGDRIGQLLAISSLTPLAIIVGFVTLILFRRDLHTIVFFAGALLNEAVNLVMKRIIAEPRPLTRKGLYTEHGMPSSHSQMMWFFSSYSILFLIFRLRHINSSGLELIWKVLVALSLIATAVVVAYSRRISERLMIRDTSLIPNIMWFEYTHARTENRARSRKLTSMKSQ